MSIVPTLAQSAEPNPAPPVATPSLLAVQNDVTRVVARVKPSVVTVICEKPSSSDDDDEDDDGDTPLPLPPSRKRSLPSEPGASLGTGWVFQADGYIVTNYHVVRDATSIRVLFNSDTEEVERVTAHLVGYDPDADLAVIKVNRSNLPALELADSNAAQVGQWTIAVGAPFDQPQTVTLGVMSAIGRRIDKSPSPSPVSYLQTDASINPGNSGGPLLDLNGRVVGLNTAILSPSHASAGIGFAIPSNTIKGLLPLLLTGKQIKRGFVGINYTRLAPRVAREFGLEGGLQIGGLAQKNNGPIVGPAKDAGVQDGDIIYAVEGRNVSNVEDFRALIATMPPGAKVNISIARPDFNGEGNVQKLDISLTLGDRALILGDIKPATFSIPKDTPIVGTGLAVKDARQLDTSQKKEWLLSGTESGAVITSIVPASSADEADLREGLRIVRARQKEKWVNIASASAWKTLEQGAAPGEHILLQLRDDKNIGFYRVLVVPSA